MGWSHLELLGLSVKLLELEPENLKMSLSNAWQTASEKTVK